MKTYKIRFLGIIAILIFIVSISGCTNSNTTSNNTGNTANKTFTNQYISFQYPGTLTVTELSALNSVQIETGNTIGANSGIQIQVLDKGGYNDAVSTTKEEGWQLKGQKKTAGGVSYSMSTKEDTYNGTAFTMNDYIFEKNGTAYDMYGNVKDANIMEGLIDSIK